MAQYGGKAIVPIEDVWDYVSHLKPTKLVPHQSFNEIAAAFVVTAVW